MAFLRELLRFMCDDIKRPTTATAPTTGAQAGHVWCRLCMDTARDRRQTMVAPAHTWMQPKAIARSFRKSVGRVQLQWPCERCYRLQWTGLYELLYPFNRIHSFLAFLRVRARVRVSVLHWVLHINRISHAMHMWYHIKHKLDFEKFRTLSWAVPVKRHTQKMIETSFGRSTAIVAIRSFRRRNFSILSIFFGDSILCAAFVINGSNVHFSHCDRFCVSVICSFP